MHRSSSAAPLRQAGFTLAELGIVTVVLGLLLAGFAALDATVASARSKSLSNDVTGLRAAYALYVLRYAAVPGDDPWASKRWLQTSGGNGDHAIAGRYDDQYAGDPTTLVVNGTQGESLAFWWHLRLADMVVGPKVGPGAVAPPRHALGGIIGVQTGVFGMQGPAVCLAKVAAAHIQFLESSLDDGYANTGEIRAGTPGEGPIAPLRERDGLARIVCAVLTGTGGFVPRQ